MQVGVCIYLKQKVRTIAASPVARVKIEKCFKIFSMLSDFVETCVLSLQF